MSIGPVQTALPRPASALGARIAGAGLFLVAAAGIGNPRIASGEAPMLVSADASGAPGNAGSRAPSISADGRLVAFSSDASNLVAGDTNGRRDIFVHDVSTRTTVRVSVPSSGGQSKSSSENPSISGDGRYVAYQSGASNLVPGDTNGVRDVFVHDIWTGATSRVSVSSTGAQANGHSFRTAISHDGRYIAFDSAASTLVSDDTNGLRDIFVHDGNTGSTTRVSVSSTGTEGNSATEAFALSGNGRYVAFESAASNLVPGDTNGKRDIFVHDLLTRTTRRATVSSSGTQANNSSENPSLAYDRYVSFESHAFNLVAGDTNRLRDVFVHDLETGATTRVSLGSDGVQANSSSAYSSISAEGRHVAFRSNASNLAAGAASGLGHIFVHDLQSGVTRLVVADPSGPHTDGSTNFIPRLSGDGRSVAFESDSPLLFPLDGNLAPDIFRALIE